MSEKTEQPTQKKLRDARKKGQVAHSKEVVSAGQILAAFALIWIGLANFLVNMSEFVVLPATFYDLPFLDAVVAVSDASFSLALSIVIPFVMVLVAVGLMANFFQIGALFAFESLKPDITKLSPAKGFKKIFSVKNLVEFIKSIIKIVFLGILVTIVIHGGMGAMMLTPECGLFCVESVFGELLKNIALYSAFAFIIVAAADFTFQKQQHTKSLKMTKDEVKREYKEMEGNPEIKGRRRQLHREMAMGGMEANVKKASVVVTNPTHIAVALYYNTDETPLPVITAKGENLVAKRIVAIAREAGIPVLQNVPLAQALNESAELDQYIPSELLEPVAEVLRLVREILEAEGEETTF